MLLAQDGRGHASDLWRPWVLGPDEAPGWLKEFDRRLRPRVFASRGRMPDVVAWNPDQELESALFAECKGPKEKNREPRKIGWPQP